MTQRTARIILGLFIATFVVVAGMAWSTGSARADSTLLGWDAKADASPIDIIVDNASGLDGVHPLSELDIPEDVSEYQTGPTAHALASVMYPGAVAGNFGSLSGELGLPSQLAPLAGQLNDPVKAETFYPAGPPSASYPTGAPSSGLAEMTSSANENQATATSGALDESVTGLVGVQDAKGSSSATATSSAQSTATGSFSGFSILGGLIQMGATTSTASAQNDGTTPSGTATTNLGAITIAGHSVTYGNGGLVIGPVATQTSALTSIPTALVNQLVSAISLKITSLPQTETSQEPNETITSAGVSISFSLPSNLAVSINCTSIPSALAQLDVLCTLPGELTGFNYTMNIGQVTAQAVATPPFSIPTTTAGTIPTPATIPASLTSSPLGNSGNTGSGSFSTPGVSTGSGGYTGSSGAGPTSAPATASSAVPEVALASTPVALSSPTGAGIVLILLALAAAMGMGLRSLAMAKAPLLEECPLEEKE